MKHRSDGFTLLELLAALLLSTLLMVAVMGVVGGLAKTEKTLDRHEATPTWQRRLVTRIERDLRAADEVDLLSQGIRLSGLLATDPSSGNSLWQKATVDYVVEKSPLGMLLIRRETAGPLASEPRYEILAQQITQLAITLPEEMTIEEFLTGSGAKEQPFMTTLTNGPPPPSLQLTIKTEPNLKPAYHQLTTL